MSNEIPPTDSFPLEMVANQLRDLLEERPDNTPVSVMCNTTGRLMLPIVRWSEEHQRVIIS